MQRSLRQLHRLARTALEPAAQDLQHQCSRGLASQRGQLGEYEGHYRPAQGISTRGQSEAGQGSASSSAAASAAAPEPPQAEGDAPNLQQQGAQAASAWMFPWEKRQMDGGSGPLRTWERVYWGGFVTAISIFLFTRLNSRGTPKGEDPEAAAKLESSRMDAARLVLAGRSFTDGLDAFEGLSPVQIQEYVDKAAAGATSKDPFEGMSPDEINSFLERQQTAAL